MAGTRTEAVLNQVTKPELVQLLLKIEANMGTQFSTTTAKVKEFNNYFKKLEEDVAIVNNVNTRLVEQLTLTDWQC